MSACIVLIHSLHLTGHSQKPELVLQTGHTGAIRSLSFSPDGKSFASAGLDAMIKLWDTKTGTELRSLKGGFAFPAVFGRDGSSITDGFTWWNTSTGEKLTSIRFGSGALAFSPDGKTVAVGKEDGTIEITDSATGRQLRTLKGPFQSCRFLTFGPNGKTLASGSMWGNIFTLWDLSTGSELNSLELATPSNSGRSVAFAPDGKAVATGSESGEVELWDLASGGKTHGFRSIPSSPVAFNRDGTILMGVGDDGAIKLWDPSSGRVLQSFGSFSNTASSIAFSPDGKTVAVGSKDGAISVWDLSTRTQLLAINKYSPPSSAVFSPDGKALAVYSDKVDSASLWNFATGSIARTFPGHVGQMGIFFSPDSTKFSIASIDGTIRLWDVSSGLEAHTIHGSQLSSMAFSPDQKTIASGNVDARVNDTTIKLWAIDSGKEIRRFKGHDKPVSAVSFSPDGKVLASESYDGIIKLWDVSSAKELRTLKATSNAFASDDPLSFLAAVFELKFSPDGKILASRSLEGDIKFWDVSTGGLLRSLKGVGITFSHDGKTFASGDKNNLNLINLFDTTTGKLERTIQGHSEVIWSLSFSSNDDYLVSVAQDQGITVWETRSGLELASLVTFEDHDWIVTTPDGLFDGSPSAWKKIIWRFNNDAYNFLPVEGFFNDFYYPGLLTDILDGKRPKAPGNLARKDRRQPRLSLSAGRVPSQKTRTISISLMVTESLSDGTHSTGSGAQDIRLFRNGSLVKVWHGDVLKGKGTATLEATIPILAGENRLTAYAFNHDNIKSQDATLTVTGTDSLKRKGTAYILAIGVNEYANTQYNLKYAVADAQDFVTEVKRQQEALGQYAKIEVLPLYNQDATKEKVLRALTDLAAKSQPEDAIIIYFSGHGAAHGNRFYLIPHDLGYQGNRTRPDSAALQTIYDHSVSDEELEQAVEGIDAGQILLVIDACNSGQALEAEEQRRGPMNSKGLAQLAYEKGMYILTAAQSYQAAFEASKLGHGYLTYALVEEGLKTAAADTAPKDGNLFIREWLDYAANRVPQMQQEKLTSGNGRQLELVVAFTNGEENLDPTKRSLQRPRVFYRREVEPQPLIVAKP
jgi:WD40 repeat protein